MEYHCSLGHFFYREGEGERWEYMSNKEVIRKLEERDELEAEAKEKDDG